MIVDMKYGEYMQYWGAIVGTVFTLISGSDFWSIILGIIIGFVFDKIYKYRTIKTFNGKEEWLLLYFNTMFEVMGYINKYEETVIVNNSIFSMMGRINLNDKLRIKLRDSFLRGQNSYFYPVRKKIKQLRQFYYTSDNYHDLAKTFLEIQIQAVLANNASYSSKIMILYIIAEELEISRTQLDRLTYILKNKASFHYKNYHNQYKSSIEEAYNVLGVKSTDDILTVKKAYHKMIGKYHPDKLAAKKLPIETIEIAKQKTQEIYKAYKLIKEQKKFH